MKTLFILVALFVSQAFAAELKLNNGESAMIRPNVMTTVSCNATNTVSCESGVATLKKLMDLCYRSSNGYDCAKTHWPKFKSNYPGCEMAGMDTCIDYCYRHANGATCAEFCQ